jgi:hypothetical protein
MQHGPIMLTTMASLITNIILGDDYPLAYCAGRYPSNFPTVPILNLTFPTFLGWICRKENAI